MFKVYTESFTIPHRATVTQYRVGIVGYPKRVIWENISFYRNGFCVEKGCFLYSYYLSGPIHVPALRAATYQLQIEAQPLP